MSPRPKHRMMESPLEDRRAPRYLARVGISHDRERCPDGEGRQGCPHRDRYEPGDDITELMTSPRAPRWLLDQGLVEEVS